MACNVFFKFTGPEILGGSTVKGHEGWQELLSYNHSFEQPTLPVSKLVGGATTKNADRADVALVMELDRSMPLLAKLSWTGKHIDKATLVAYRSAGDTGSAQLGAPYLKIEFESVIITHLDISGGGGGAPTVSFAVNYAKVTYTYNQQDHTKGTVGADQPVSHDLRTNEVA